MCPNLKCLFSLFTFTNFHSISWIWSCAKQLLYYTHPTHIWIAHVSVLYLYEYFKKHSEIHLFYPQQEKHLDLFQSLKLCLVEYSILSDKNAVFSVFDHVGNRTTFLKLVVFHMPHVSMPLLFFFGCSVLSCKFHRINQMCVLSLPQKTPLLKFNMFNLFFLFFLLGSYLQSKAAALSFTHLNLMYCSPILHSLGECSASSFSG